MYTWYFFGTNYSSDVCLQHLFTSIFLWLAVLAVLGCGKAWLDRTSKFSGYMTKASFGIYIVHYSITIAICYLLKNYTTLPPVAIYGLSIVTVVFGSVALNELLRRIPILRYCVLGIQKNRASKARQQAGKDVSL